MKLLSILILGKYNMDDSNAIMRYLQNRFAFREVIVTSENDTVIHAAHRSVDDIWINVGYYSDRSDINQLMRDIKENDIHNDGIIIFGSYDFIKYNLGAIKDILYR